MVLEPLRDDGSILEGIEPVLEPFSEAASVVTRFGFLERNGTQKGGGGGGGGGGAGAMVVVRNQGGNGQRRAILRETKNPWPRTRNERPRVRWSRGRVRDVDGMHGKDPEDTSGNE